MICNWNGKNANGRLYELIDLATGKPHSNMDIFYADDEAGIVRFFKQNDKGGFYHATKDGTPVNSEPFKQFRRVNEFSGELEYIHEQILRDGSRRIVTDDEIELAWAEEHCAIKLVRKPL